MHKDDQIYTILCALFSVIIVMGNLIYQKFVLLPISPFHTFEISVGAALYPLTFFLTNLITEFYGKEKARFCMQLGISINILVALIIFCMDNLEATSWSRVDNALFHRVFGAYSVAFIGSVIACYVTQTADIVIYLWIRKVTKNRWLWVRNSGSNLISLFIDTFIVITFMRIFGILPSDRLLPLIFDSYLYKSFFVVSSTPLFYILVKAIKKRLAL